VEWFFGSNRLEINASGALIEERLNIESTSTWIRGDRAVIDTTG
jgi:hypothetical protein